MSKMISVAPGFQYSVNIGFDLNNEDKLQNFIPTKSALELLEETLVSTRPTATDLDRQEGFGFCRGGQGTVGLKRHVCGDSALQPKVETRCHRQL